VLKRSFEPGFRRLRPGDSQPCVSDDCIAHQAEFLFGTDLIPAGTSWAANGKHFTLLKFRTMHCSPPAESDTTWTAKHDPRRTAIGAILRKFSLDELPQLLMLFAEK